MMNTVSSLFLLHVLFLRIAECQEDVAKGEESSAPAPGGKAGANGASLCDKAKWEEYLGTRKNAESPSNRELMKESELECRSQLRDLSKGMFGPPRFWEIYKVACSNQCDAWDGLVGGGLALSRCSYKELNVVTQSTAFWQCKILFDCYENEDGVRDPLAHRENFCNGCGTSQTSEERFYEELDCGSGVKAGLSANTKVMVVLTFITLALALFC